MYKITTPLKIVFFSLLLAGIIAIQYSWIIALQKEKSEKFESDVVLGISNAARDMRITGSLYTLTNTAVTSALQRSFYAQGLGAIPFEFNLVLARARLTSKGFNEKLTSSLKHLTFSYSFQHDLKKPSPGDLLTVIMPSANRFAWKEMTWMIVISVLLILIILTIFYYTIISERSGKQLFYSHRDHVIESIVQRLEVPLSTVSVAAEALRNAKVMQDAAKINFYQQVINEENNRIDEEVKRFMQELK